ncbi:hypothetical protein MMC22_006344 [Lobaria immixta]|nr:hypothetical protein [Lobaria immixta]
MVKFWDHIPDNLRDWALEQQVFFTASAPLAGKHVNLSPKGLPATTFSIFDSNHAAYVDATGSGCETISHIYENGRVTIMFCSFLTMPRIMRFFCMGKVIEWDQPEFESLIRKMGKEKIEGARAIILLDVFKVQTSCGFGVPLLSADPINGDPASIDEKPVLKDRETLGHWASVTIEKGKLQKYQRDMNADSLDGLPGLRVARRDAGEHLWMTETTAHVRRIGAQKEALLVGVGIGILLILVVQSAQAMLGGN